MTTRAMSIHEKAATAAVGDQISLFKHLSDGQTMLEYLEQVKRKEPGTLYSEPDHTRSQHAKSKRFSSSRKNKV